MKLGAGALLVLAAGGPAAAAPATVFVKPNMVTLPWASRSYDPFRLGECTKPEILVAVVAHPDLAVIDMSIGLVGARVADLRIDWRPATPAN